MITHEQQKINRIAAAMAVSNYGHGVDEARVLGWRPNPRFGNSPRSEVNSLASHLMETEDDKDTFADEAEGWAKTIAKSGIIKFAEDYPHHTHWIMQIKDM